MPDEEIKSPLPPRRYISETEDDTTAIEPTPVVPTATPTPEVETVEAVRAVPAANVEVAKVEVPTNKGMLTSRPLAPKIKSKLPLFLGIGIGLIIVLGLIYKIVNPRYNGIGTKEVTINYWGLWEDAAVIEGVIADYESKNPGVKINYLRNQITNYRSRLQSRLETDTATGEVPDIFRIHASWLPMFQGDLAKVPGETAQSIGLDSDYFGTYANELKVSGSWMAIPLMYDGLSLFYNKDLIESAQVDLPKSWWDLETAANKLTVRDANGKITTAGVALGMTDNIDQWSDVLGLMLQQGGVNVLATDEVNTKKLGDVLTFYTLFKTKDHVWDESLPNSTQLFANGKLAFYFGPSWRVFNIEDTKIPSLRYGITNVPQLPTLGDDGSGQVNNTNLTNINWSSYWVEGVNPKSENQAEAWKFLAFLSTKESLEKLYAAESQVRSFGEIYPRKDMAESIATNDKLKAFVTAADSGLGWYLSSNTYDEGLNDTMIGYFGNAINSMLYKNTPVELVLPDLRNGINQLVQKYGLK